MKSRRSEDDWERWVAKALAAPHLREAPEGAVRKALALGSQLDAPRPAGVRWLVELLFDSAAQPLPAGVRSVSTGQRRLLYRAQTSSESEVQLDLRVRRESRGTLELTGQFLPPWSQARVEASAGRTKRKQALSDAGEFLLRGLPGKAGSLRLEIRSGRDKLVIADVPLLVPESEQS